MSDSWANKAIEDMKALYEAELANLRIDRAAKETEALGYLRAVGTLQERIDKLEKAVKDLRPPQRASDCWCWYSHDVERCGHQIQCVNARAALDQSGGANG